ncbi:hypothetical protein BCR33DRAFT_581396 [Rhizoclosmatium globosum]|uniref:Transcription factor domain-containing protein n=1 Tax=Rhizoclosmatium globosum TaxID=329046 RepID=A0A1Y2CQY0_9FUNG|nr:hypothetical protein BCR33DRAFT_581396 [Rhizoclosmatium globosum]|eukprot:ORY49373.1 hypothetical protein BCR33DRAFT_581396 [Rhizoclosmatium globosum]
METRLVLCAISAFCSGSMSEESGIWFFKRARKAVLLAADRPSVSSANAFFWIYVFSMIMGRDEIGIPFLKMAVDIVINLRFYIDPDDSPWLVGLNETEKEERRRLFWALCMTSRCEIGRSLGWGLQELSTDHMKLLRPIPGAFKEMHYYQEFCEVHSLIIAIKRHHSSAPNSIQDMLSSPELLTLHMH